MLTFPGGWRLGKIRLFPMGRFYIRLVLQLCLLAVGLGITYRILGSRATVVKQYNHKVQPVFLEKMSSHAGYLSGFKKDRNELIEGLNLKSDLLQQISNGSLYRVDINENDDWRKPLTYFEPSGLKLPDGRKKCRVLTYFSHLSGAQEDLAAEKRMLHTWQMAMWAHGFDPVVATEKDAKAHEKYSEFIKNAVDASWIEKYQHIFAWDTMGGGLFMNYHMLPVVREIGEPIVAANETVQGAKTLLPFLQQCNYVGKPFMYLPYEYGIFYGGSSFGKDITDRLSTGGDDKFIAKGFKLMHEGDTFARYTPESCALMLDQEDPVSLDTVAEMMEVHLHQAFIKRYTKGGISIVHPMEDKTETLIYPMLEIAKRVALCRESDVINTCPPNHSNLRKAVEKREHAEEYKEAGYAMCGNPCASDSPQIAEEVLQENGKKVIKRYALHMAHTDALLPPDSDTLTLVAVPHPLTALALLEGRPNVGTLDARQYLLKDTFIRQLTSYFIPGNTVGTSHRLLLCKDSMFQSIYWSNTFWSLWEKLTVESLPEYEQFLNHQFGFPLPKLRQEPELIEASDFEDATDATLLSTVRKRVLNRASDREIPGVESWNIADTELWMFLDSWMDILRDKFQGLIDKEKNIDRLY